MTQPDEDRTPENVIAAVLSDARIISVLKDRALADAIMRALKLAGFSVEDELFNGPDEQVTVTSPDRIIARLDAIAGMQAQNQRLLEKIAERVGVPAWNSAFEERGDSDLPLRAAITILQNSLEEQAKKLDNDHDLVHQGMAIAYRGASDELEAITGIMVQARPVAEQCLGAHATQAEHDQWIAARGEGKT